MVDVASQMDSRLYEYKMSSRQPNTAKPRREKTTLEGGDAMALDAANRKEDKKGSGKNGKKPKGPNPNWTDEQKQRYHDRLCITCGSDKHFSPKCPQNPRNKDKGKQTSSAQREASVITRQRNHDRLSWTTCFDDDCNTHRDSKATNGWYPSEPRLMAVMTRSEEPAEAKQRDEEERFACEFARANIDAFPPDEEIVNSETGELYESTNASTKDEDARQERRKILEETFLLA
ncbi:hypothetical protein DBV05_g12784 [Lasiodiplodia theobromae]|uniref:CCHC-type domain-containing protein n=1 Tax=Lasiodiplodia theobromae TaxID=45133 RepID=A0A5N5CT68_9PEZI|nr:hypothetical protein DBV05_g12784 [Lasiodiplodia theobromae]